MDTEHETDLTVYSDCCYSGRWAKALDEHAEQFTNEGCYKLKKDYDPKKLLKKKGKFVRVFVYAACAHDEVATENVFTDLLKGQLPDERTFASLKKVLYGDWEEGYTAKKMRSREEREIGKDQHLTYGEAFIRDEKEVYGWKE